MKVIDKDKLLEELKKLKQNLSASPIVVIEDVESLVESLEAKKVDFERELGKYISEGIHRFFPGVEDDYCTMDTVIWQDYVSETAKYFFELGLKAMKGE